MLSPEFQAKISPPVVGGPMELNTAQASNPNANVKPKAGELDFLKLMQESNSDSKMDREARKNGDLSSAKNYDDFLQKLSEQSVTRRDPKNVLNKDDFLKLFVTQLQNQDPLNPDDGAEMASKLAQFNSLEQMLNVNTTLEKMFKQQTNARNTELINYVGKDVTVDGGRLRLKGGAHNESVYNLKAPSNETTLEVRDSGGTVVFTQDLGNVAAGEHKFAWLGKNKEGQSLPDGVYTYNIIAKGINSEPVPVEITTEAKITGVDIKDMDGGLFTNLGVVKLDAVKAIGQAGFIEAKPAGQTKVDPKDAVNKDKANANGLPPVQQALQQVQQAVQNAPQGQVEKQLQPVVEQASQVPQPKQPTQPLQPMPGSAPAAAPAKSAAPPNIQQAGSAVEQSHTNKTLTQNVPTQVLTSANNDPKALINPNSLPEQPASQQLPGG